MTKKIYFFILLLIFGITVRFIFLQDVIKSPFLNILLPGTDEFNYMAIAPDENSLNPLHLKMTVYPAYLYFLRILFKFFGNDYSFVYYFQFLLSCFSVIILFFTGNILSGFIPGMICGVLYLLYKMTFIYDVILIPTAVSQVFIILMLFFFFINRKYKNFSYYAGFTLSGIFTCFFRPFFWFLFIPGAIYFFFEEKQWKYTKYIVSNFFIILLSVLLFNTFHTPESFLHKFGIMFYIANHEKASGLLMPVPDIPMTAEAHCKNSIKVAYYESKDKSKINTFWIRKTLESMKNHPLDFIKLIFMKINFLVNNYEIHNNESVYFYEQNTILDDLPKINFAFLFSLSMTGIILSLVYKHNHVLLFSLLYLVIMVLTMPLCSRYRMPLIPFLCLFAGYGAACFLDMVKEKKYVQMLSCILIIISSLFWSYLNFFQLDKTKDLKFWEKTKEKKINYIKAVKKAAYDYKNINTLTHEQAVNLTLNLARLHCYQEFFGACNVLLPVIKDENLKIRLLKQEAIVYETIFNFDKALIVWKQIKFYKPLKKLADYKISELKIYNFFLK